LTSVYRVDLRKALNPLNDDDFLVIVQQLSDRLQRVIGPVEKAAVEAAMAALDVDLAALTGAEVAQLAHAVNLALRDIPLQVLPRINGLVRHDIAETVGQTQVRAAATHSWAIGTSLEAVDQQMLNAMANVSSWVTDEYGRRAAMMELGVQRVVQEGMAQGLRSADIAEDLKKLGQGSINRSRNYWDLVATNLQNRARGFGHLRSMDKAGITTYEYVAVMDERTSDPCRALHGAVFPVSTGLRAYSDLALQSANDSQAVEKVMPFVQRRRADDGALELFVQPPGSGATVIARTIQSAVGQVDTRGTFTDVLSPSQLAAAGVTVPPIHNRCRSTIEPVI
jgi:SPP1 gp7 family putative phage head morphogenesis protein